MVTLGLIALGVVATARLDRLIRTDTITAPARNAVLHALGVRARTEAAARWLAQLLACVWCGTVWAGAAVAALQYLALDLTLDAPWWAAIPLLALVYSQVASTWATIAEAIETYDAVPGEQAAIEGPRR